MTKMSDTRIVKVSILKGRPKIEAERQGLSPDDLVVVTVSTIDGFPEYHIEKVEGDPTSFLLSKVQSSAPTVKRREE